MEWLRTHPYASAAATAGCLLLAGAYFVELQSPVRTVSQTGTWGSGVELTPSSVPAATPQDTSRTTLLQQVQSNAPYTYLAPLTITRTDQETTDGTSNAGGFDFAAFLASISASSSVSSGAASSQTNADIANSYAYIPGGLISVTSPSTKRTKVQQSLYDYGNNVGSLIQSFETEHGNEAQVLTDEAQDRTDPAKTAALARLGTDLSQLGQSMLDMDGVPTQAAAAHAALAASYQQIGAGLVAVSKTQRDSDFVAAVQAYDTTADTFIQQYVALAQLFSTYGVTFAQGDPGEVFSFTATDL